MLKMRNPRKKTLNPPHHQKRKNLSLSLGWRYNYSDDDAFKRKPSRPKSKKSKAQEALMNKPIVVVPGAWSNEVQAVWLRADQGAEHPGEEQDARHSHLMNDTLVLLHPRSHRRRSRSLTRPWKVECWDAEQTRLAGRPEGGTREPRYGAGRSGRTRPERRGSSITGKGRKPQQIWWGRLWEPRSKKEAD